MVGILLVKSGELMFKLKSFYDGFFQGILICGIIGILTTNLIWIFKFPELTTAQVFLKFWPLYLMLIFYVLISLLWFKKLN